MNPVARALHSAAAAVAAPGRLDLVLVLSAVLAACAGPPNPGLRAPRAEPVAVAAGVDWAETSFAGADGLPLYAQSWRPSASEPRGVLVIHHGLVDHSARYQALAERFVAAGYAVWALDMRGHGRSAGARVAIDSADDLLGDLDALFALVRASEPELPMFLYGHSVGGLVSALYAIERQPALAGLVLVAPAIAFDAPPIQAAGLGVVAALDPDAAVLETPHRDFTRDPALLAEIAQDPLIWQPNGAARTARTVLDGAARVWAAPERLRVPLLVVHGTGDARTAPAGSRELVARAGSTDKTLRLHQGVLHDVLRAPDGVGDSVAGDIVTWVDAHASEDAPAAVFNTPTISDDRPLSGDRRGEALSVELDLRGELARGDGDGRGLSGGLRVRVGRGRATALGLGYFGGLDVRGGYLGGGIYELDAHLVGLAARSRAGAVLAVTGGVGIGGVRGAGATQVPVEIMAELPAGPVRLLARAGLGWRLSGAEFAGDAAGLADQASALIGVRLGRDTGYWADLSAGAGPYLAATYRDLGGAEYVGLALGLDLWGGN